ncbi:hypothetical protein SAMN05443582_104363 [Phyllobacterium sp. OV277]|nr:hypothetical protein SAMN05443582_104363 [Phyllobacterium sp. OV277]
MLVSWIVLKAVAAVNPAQLRLIPHRFDLVLRKP